MFLVSSWDCLYPICCRQVLSREWRCSWSSADRRCSNYIWVIDNLIAYWSASYIRDLTLVCQKPGLRQQAEGCGRGGCTWSGFIQGCAALVRTVPYFKESRTPKTYPILGKTHNPGHRTSPECQNIPYFKENLIILGTRCGPDSDNTPFFRENLVIPGTWSGQDTKIIPHFRGIWWNHTLFYGNWPSKLTLYAHIEKS